MPLELVAPLPLAAPELTEPLPAGLPELALPELSPVDPLEPLAPLEEAACPELTVALAPLVADLLGSSAHAQMRQHARIADSSGDA
jgi:hypothetical protein